MVVYLDIQELEDDRDGCISHMTSHVTHTLCPLLIFRHAGVGESVHRSHQGCQAQADSGTRLQQEPCTHSHTTTQSLAIMQLHVPCHFKTEVCGVASSSSAEAEAHAGIEATRMQHTIRYLTDHHTRLLSRGRH